MNQLSDTVELKFYSNIVSRNETHNGLNRYFLRLIAMKIDNELTIRTHLLTISKIWLCEVITTLQVVVKVTLPYEIFDYYSWKKRLFLKIKTPIQMRRFGEFHLNA